jgi:hypothetical protein
MCLFDLADFGQRTPVQRSKGGETNYDEYSKQQEENVRGASKVAYKFYSYRIRTSVSFMGFRPLSVSNQIQHPLYT